MNETLKHTFERKDHAFTLAVVAILFSFLAFGFSSLKPKKVDLMGHLVVVDMSKLLHHKASQLATLKTHEGNQEVFLQEQARHIKKILQTYAQSHQVIVAAKGALFHPDLKEVTDDILKLL